jgi:hypothetical protein
MVARHRRRSPPADDRELSKAIIRIVAQGLFREALLIVLREIWRGGPW